MTFAELYSRCTSDEQFALDERAAIYEYDANLPREEAERKAAAELEAAKLKAAKEAA